MPERGSITGEATVALMMRDAVVVAAATSCMRTQRPRMIYTVVSLEKSLIILGRADGETPVDKICHCSNIMAKCY